MNKIPSKAKVRVVWEDTTDNYTQERSKRITKYISDKYSIDNVQVVFKPKKVIKDGQEIEMSMTDNLMDTEYQRKLFKEYLETNTIEIEWDRFVKLDDKVNEKLKEEREIDYRYRNWYIREIEWSNFMSFGDGNYINYDEINGLSIINSSPANTGGKTIFSSQLLLFLFFNTTTNTSKATDLFNRFRDDCDEVKVKGRVTIDGVDYIIERKVIRSLKRSGDEYNVKTELSFQKIMPDNSIIDLEGEQRRETEEMIQKSIGSMDDFLLTIIADANNLEDIIHTKPTERGRILSRFIGLEILDDKETIVKDMKSKWAKNLKSDQFNTEELKINNSKLEIGISTKKTDIEIINKEIVEVEEDIKKSSEKKDELLSKKIEIDKEIINLRIDDIERDINNITEKGKNKKKEYDDAKIKLSEIEEITYDESAHNLKLKELSNLKEEQSKVKYIVRDTEQDVTKLKKLIKELEESEFCPVCKKPMDDVDHAEDIEKHKDGIITLENKKKENELIVEEYTEKINNVSKEVVVFEEDKQKSLNYDRVVITIDKLEIDLEKLRLERKEKLELKEKYNANIENIEKNKEIDTQILGYTQRLTGLERDKLDRIRNVDRLENEIKTDNLTIEKNKEIVKSILQEEEVRKIFDIYIKAVGKNGISKMVMKKVLPLINSELERLLIDTINFKVMVDINDKQEVEFLLEKEHEGELIKYPVSYGSGLEKTVSSLGLRCILSKVSCLPKPNIIVFDEVLGKVANENLELMQPFFGKIKDLFPNVFLITHNEQVKDWGDKIITIIKTDNISKIVK